MINIGILGCGHMSRKLTRTLRAMRDQGADIRLYAAAARDMERAQVFCREEGFERAYGSYEELAADPAVQLAYIGTPHSHHAEHMKLCIAHGKSVLCEKAFTLSAAQAKEVLAMARQKGVLAAEAIWTRYMPSRRIIKELLDSGVIGEPRLLAANLHYPVEYKERIIRPELGGGALLDLGVYVLNFACMFFGSDFERMESSVQLTDTGVDRQESISLYYRDGRAAQLTAGVTCRSDRRGLISGTKGYITIDNVNNPLRAALYLADENFETAHEIPLPEPITGYEHEINACLRAMEQGETECADMPHSEIIRMMEIMDELRAAWGVRFESDT